MWQERLSKIQVAEWQLFRAIDLFCSHQDAICAITLAGAAEQVLGDLLKQGGHVTSLDEDVNDMYQMHRDSFRVPPDKRDYYWLQNHARNALKHLGESDSIVIDLEEEAVSLIDRAIRNYQGLLNRYPLAFQKFENNASAWYNARCQAVISTKPL